MTITAAPPTVHAHVPQHLPAYVRTNSLHHGSQPFEAQSKAQHLLSVLHHRSPTDHNQLQSLFFTQDDPQANGSLTLEQAHLIAMLARRFDRKGDTLPANEAELTLNASDILLEEIRPRSVAESMQADRKARRFAEIRLYFQRMSHNYELPF